MKDYLAQLVEEAPDTLKGRHVTREYLQARILSSLQRAGAMIPLAFHGGTALRFLYHIPRYSEDLDFALEQATETYDFRSYLGTVRSNLLAEAYPVELKVNDQKTVHSALVRFRGLFYELNLSPHADEVLSIKIEVDTRPPSDAGLQSTIVRRYVLLHLQHHDQPSLLAGKLHAILQRPYAKGRDLYDLFWYLSNPDWPEPNIQMLNNALEKTGWQGRRLMTENWREAVWSRLQSIDWETAVAEVQPFLIDLPEARLLTRDNLRQLLLQQ